MAAPPAPRPAAPAAAAAPPPGQGGLGADRAPRRRESGRGGPSLGKMNAENQDVLLDLEGEEEGEEEDDDDDEETGESRAGAGRVSPSPPSRGCGVGKFLPEPVSRVGRAPAVAAPPGGERDGGRRGLAGSGACTTARLLLLQLLVVFPLENTRSLCVRGRGGPAGAA